MRVELVLMVWGEWCWCLGCEESGVGAWVVRKSGVGAWGMRRVVLVVKGVR